jgi:thioredoxin-like negative regulator of GroEL
MEIRDISTEELKMIQNYGSSVIQFYKPRSEECELLTQEFAKIPNEGLHYQAFRFNVEQDPSILEYFNIEKVPTLLVVRGEEILGRKESFITANEIAEWAHFSVIMGW